MTLCAILSIFDRNGQNVKVFVSKIISMAVHGKSLFWNQTSVVSVITNQNVWPSSKKSANIFSIYKLSSLWPAKSKLNRVNGPRNLQDFQFFRSNSTRMVSPLSFGYYIPLSLFQQSVTKWSNSHFSCCHSKYLAPSRHHYRNEWKCKWELLSSVPFPISDRFSLHKNLSGWIKVSVPSSQAQSYF